MAVAFKRGTTTGPGDLAIMVRDVSNNLIDPFRLQYAVYDYTTGIEILQGSPINDPVRISLGQYYASVSIPADANIGDWRIRWTIQETAADPVYQSVQEFNVVGDSTVVSFTGNANLDRLIYSLRILLGDNNPDRLYRFRPPESERFIQGQTQVFGYIWEDEELYEFLQMAVDDFNSRPPTTDLQFQGLWGTERRWRTAVLTSAAFYACAHIAMVWIANEFSLCKDEQIQVRDDQDVIHTLSMEDLFNLIHGDLIFSTRKKVKETVQALALADGNEYDFEEEEFVEQLEYSDQIKKSFQNGNLKVKSVCNGQVKWVKMTEVMRHFTPFKRMLKITTEIGSVVVTEDHSLFNPCGIPLASSEIVVGEEILGVIKEGQIGPVKILQVEEAETEDYTYDISVPETESFVLESGILAHNSYSISGVSLDIEKSSKYQAMKDEYMNQYDKLVEAAKRSIKIIVGLRQFRYGIGITSALGPLSRPGVQSRRNWISSGAPSWS